MIAESALLDPSARQRSGSFVLDNLRIAIANGLSDPSAAGAMSRLLRQGERDTKIAACKALVE
jgi:hypothetical protein